VWDCFSDMICGLWVWKFLLISHFRLDSSHNDITTTRQKMISVSMTLLAHFWSTLRAAAGSPDPDRRGSSHAVFFFLVIFHFQGGNLQEETETHARVGSVSFLFLFLRGLSLCFDWLLKSFIRHLIGPSSTRCSI